MRTGMRGWFVRGMGCSAWILLLAAVFATPVWAQKAGGKDKEKDKEKFDPVVRSLETRDGGTLKGTYFQSNRGKDASVVVLLHMADGNRMIWQGKESFAARLQNEGYAVLTLDLRGHGDSKGDGAVAAAAQSDKKTARKAARKIEYQQMVEFDMEAVNRFLLAEHQLEHLNMNKTAFVGPEMGATIASFAALRDWQKPRYDDAPAGSGMETPRGDKVRAVILISPIQNLQGLNIAAPLKPLSDPRLGVAFMVAVAQKDKEDKGQAKKTYEQIATLPRSDERMYYREYPGAFRGTELLGKKTKLEEHMLVFLNKHLRDLEIPWTDRRPADEREK
jgi:pimeloyl-ACP methyl ester carboxylesterase